MATRAPRRGTRAGNPLGEADGPPRARAEEKGGRGGRRAPAPYLPRPRTRARARARSARPGHRGLRRGPTLARLPLSLISAGLDPPAAPQGELASAAEGHRGVPRAGAGAGAPGVRKAEEKGAETGGRETRDRNRDARPFEGRGRGASPARPRGRVRREDAPRRSERRDASRGGGTASREKVRRRPARAPGPRRCPVRADVRVLSRTTHAHNPETGGHAHAPPGHPRSHLFSLRTCAHRAAAASTKAAAAGAAAAAAAGPSPPRPAPRHTRESLPHVDPSRPARGGTTRGPTRPTPPPLDARTSRRVPHRARPGERRRRGEEEEGAPTRAARERERRSRGEREGPEGRGAGGRARDARGGATAARPPPTTTPAHV